MKALTQRQKAARYIERALRERTLYYADVAAIVEAFQAQQGISDDGMPGPRTVARARALRDGPGSTD